MLLVPPFFVSHFVSCVCSRVPGPTNSTFSSVPPAPVPGPATHPEPSAHSWMTAAGDSTGRLSSDEGDAETAEDGDRPSFHCSNHHPQPLGVSIVTVSDFFFFFFFAFPFTYRELFGIKLKSNSVWSIKIWFIYITVLIHKWLPKRCVSYLNIWNHLSLFSYPHFSVVCSAAGSWVGAITYLTGDGTGWGWRSRTWWRNTSMHRCGGKEACTSSP